MKNQLLNDQIKALVTTSHENLIDWLKYLISVDGGKKSLDSSIQIYDIHNFQGFSGYNYWVDDVMVGQLQIATLQACGFVIYRRLFIDGDISESYEYYNQDARSMFTQSTLDGGVIFYNSINMDPTNPVVNHLYNILSAEYDQTSTGYSRTRLVLSIEGLLKSLYNNPATFISAKGVTRDLALRNIYNEIHKTELDPVLTYEERQSIYRNLKSIRSKIIRTKKRVHGFLPFAYNFKIFTSDLVDKLKVIKMRPASNIMGIFNQMTVGNLLWFLRTVRANLGLSIAMAIYTPFTFYFITQPMNPHAMQVVGEVRSAFLSASKEIQTWFEMEKPKTKLIAQATAQPNIQDEVSTQQAATANAALTLPANKNISWEQRMSHFKAMQINYEGNLIFASRMGRIEQMESQLSFPLTAEASWNEIKFYENEAKAALQYNTNLDPNYRNFLNSELERIKKLKIYIWHKVAQFFLDHPYIVVDQNNEQTAKDYYIGRSFVFMKNMTKELMKDNDDLAPATHAKVMELADHFEAKKINGLSVLDTLKKNSIAYANEDTFDSEALRKKVNRHWEILFIQQNKKQEASSFGLQIYTWSVRNALWTLQTIYSAKREELPNLTYKYNMNNQNTSNIRASEQINETYASMLNLMVLEFVSFSKELKTLKADNEATLRKDVIEMMEESFQQRDKLYGINREVARH